MTTIETLSESVVRDIRNVHEAFRKLDEDMERAEEVCRKVQEKRIG